LRYGFDGGGYERKGCGKKAGFGALTLRYYAVSGPRRREMRMSTSVRRR